MDRHGAYNEEERRYGRRRCGEYEEETRHDQGMTRKVVQCYLCKEDGHNAPSCPMNYIRYQEVCYTCGKYGHNSYTCPSSRGYYDASACEKYNKQEVYQQERWNDHRPNSQDLGWKDNSNVSPQILNKLEEFYNLVEEFMEKGENSFYQFSQSYLQSKQRFMARQQIPQSLEDNWQKGMGVVNQKIKEAKKRLEDSFLEGKRLAESMQLHPKEDAATEAATEEELIAVTRAAKEEEEEV